VLLAGIFGAWLLFEWRRQRRERLAFRGVVQCTMCGCEFLDTTAEELAACPRCGTRNERIRASRL
jgi:hypothetical protein